LSLSLSSILFCGRERRLQEKAEKKQQEAVAAIASGESDMSAAAVESQGKKWVACKCDAEFYSEPVV
jgi:hypothetical protein